MSASPKQVTNFFWSFGRKFFFAKFSVMGEKIAVNFLVNMPAYWHGGTHHSVTAEIFLICTNVTRTNVAWTNIAPTNVTVTVGICSRCSQEPTCKVSSKSGQ